MKICLCMGTDLSIYVFFLFIFKGSFEFSDFFGQILHPNFIFGILFRPNIFLGFDKIPISFLGCLLECLRNHFSSQFHFGMPIRMFKDGRPNFIFGLNPNLTQNQKSPLCFTNPNLILGRKIPIFKIPIFLGCLL